MKKFTVEEAGMLLTALNHMKNEIADKAVGFRKANAVFSAQYYKERSEAYKQLFYKVAEMMDYITG